MGNQMRMTNYRRGEWEEQYDLWHWQPRTQHMLCVRPLIGKRCVSRYSVRECEIKFPHGLTDHGRYYQGVNGLRISVAQPYDPLGDDERNMLARVADMGLYVHVGAYGDGWYNTATFPVIVSNLPIPEHCYKCLPYTEDAP